MGGLPEELRKFLIQAKANDFPLNFSIQLHDTPNEEIVQLTAEKTKIGAVDRKFNPILEKTRFYDTQIIEDGGILVVSQSVTGFVNFIVYPRCSDRITPLKKELILCSPLDPAYVTRDVVQKMVKVYLLILQDSSVMGTEDALNFLERAKVSWIYFQELRSRHDFYRSVLFLKDEWLKACIAGLFGFIGGYFAGLLTK
jgi:hypothetical protein